MTDDEGDNYSGCGEQRDDGDDHFAEVASARDEVAFEKAVREMTNEAAVLRVG